VSKDIHREIPEGCVPGVCTKQGWDVFNCNKISDVPCGLEESIACADEHTDKRNEGKSGRRFSKHSASDDKPLGVTLGTMVVSYEDKKDQRAHERHIDS